MKRNLKAVLFDLSGTLHIDQQVTPNAVEALKQLRATSKVPVRFISNTFVCLHLLFLFCSFVYGLSL